MQQAAEVDLDRLVDYKTEYCSVIKKHRRQPHRSVSVS